MYSEFAVKREIEDIERGEESPIRKARRLIKLSRNIRHFSRKVADGAGILSLDDDSDGAERLAQTVQTLKRLQEQARLSAFQVLKTNPTRLGFRVQGLSNAYPSNWTEVKESGDRIHALN